MKYDDRKIEINDIIYSVTIHPRITGEAAIIISKGITNNLKTAYSINLMQYIDPAKFCKNFFCFYVLCDVVKGMTR